MPLINLMVIYLQRKYGVPLHNFFEKWSSGISYLKPRRRISFAYFWSRRIFSPVCRAGLFFKNLPVLNLLNRKGGGGGGRGDVDLVLTLQLQVTFCKEQNTSFL